MNETWSTLTTDDVLSEFTPMETALCNSIKGSASELDRIISGVISQVRKAYLDGGRSLDGGAGTIPEGEHERAIAIARWKLITSLPQLKVMQTDGRKKAAEDAESWLNQIAKRELKGTGGAEIVSGETRRATRSKLDGIL